MHDLLKVMHLDGNKIIIKVTKNSDLQKSFKEFWSSLSCFIQFALKLITSTSRVWHQNPAIDIVTVKLTSLKTTLFHQIFHQCHFCPGVLHFLTAGFYIPFSCRICEIFVYFAFAIMHASLLVFHWLSWDPVLKCDFWKLFFED